ncbi:DNA repair protein RecN [Fischerella thermalis]|jgi:DNA repair protein RecN (Recombination protein N)|uniref:DNA repair protein RecN n=1 Tax=Fischerella thermalis JSC-11 TaxID=741277 RepID=G6FXW8_9CYAN|nr:DNA repair protein RecN [Fischerella thermalis]EHC10180.1 DNA repair protein RecN [Fischerella thermalis JSC-11]MBF1989549.1 DNA repair protein RecN [Fischerella thermalis M58_A2018_009]MBF2060993.1 DNA repair protein RecN [Fischerella thermalis M66_A2018_004]MBF2070455.1 DNA repair protein RecN [Fischerella thermalis M48_A2018_028]PLZ07833.1 DNA repair protein RecN [Fischerella thermalis WC119]
MLSLLRIENFALIDQLELEFGPGLNVLTGETGAGKSIILDAIDAVLGGKVSSRVIRTGTNRAMVEATFTSNSALAAWLTEQEIDLIEDNSIFISREITATSGKVRSRSRVNGVLVNQQFISELRDRLVEITAQGQTVLVGQSAQIRDWLDAYGGDSVLQQRQEVAHAFNAYQQAQQALEKRRTSERERLQQLDLLTYQVKELGEVNLGEPDELEQLQQERQRLNHVVELQQMSYKVYQALYQNDGEAPTATDLLADSETVLSDMVEYDSQMQTLLDMVRDAQATVVEVARQINAYGESLEADPQRLEEVEERIRELKQICRKYGPTLAEAIAYYQRIQAELAELNDSEQSIESLEIQQAECLAKLTQACQKLTQLRRTAAAKLEAKLIRELKPLAMEKVQFQVEIALVPPTIVGADKITFMFSPNPGEPLQPLSEIASGGEMSRFLLALKACFSQAETTGTMVFDEIDVGVSGRVAQAIAEKLHQLSQFHQVLCVTHQPLVAAMADRHFRVDKQVINQIKGKKEHNGSSEERTVVRITTLDNLTKRREELAQLAGGKSAQEAIAFAESLLTQAANHRQQKH